MSVTKPTKRERTRDLLLLATQELLLEAGGGRGLAVSEVTGRAGVAHGTFYNHFDSIHDALNGVSDCIMREHSRVLDELLVDVSDRAERFARSTRQSLRMVPDSLEYGQLLFDSGLPVDRLAAGIRARMHADIILGVGDDAFRVNDVELTVSILAGTILGLILDLYRGQIGPEAIEPATEQMLKLLGVTSRRAQRLSRKPHDFLKLRSLPLSSLPVSADAGSR
ncbi:MAG: TetR/AcrR family transcriptional regulator [Actinomycetes bacterium]